MKQDDFNSNTLSNNLAERVKELECLYNISRIATMNKYDLDKALTLIIDEIPKGWQYPERMAAFLRYGQKEIGERPIIDKSQSVQLHLGPESTGELFVFYKDGPQNTAVFLREEQALLNQIGYEISSLIELDIKRQNELKIQEKLRFSDRLNVLGELTAGIAHELNTPLGNIMGYTELLQKKETDLSKKNDLDKVLKSAMHAREIVKKLMFFSCDMPSQFKKTNLNDLVLECIDLLKIQLTEKSIIIKTDLSEKLPEISIDRIQFTQVIFNIVLNAIDAMQPGGVLNVSTNFSETSVLLSIRDTGKGIPNEELSRLFQPFYTNKGENGTGLGLAVTYGIIQAHKGQIEVESIVNKGTTFTISLTRK